MADDQMDIGTLIDEPERPYSLVRRDLVAQLLAGIRFPGAKSFQHLPAAQKQTAREAADAALTRLYQHID